MGTPPHAEAEPALPEETWLPSSVHVETRPGQNTHARAGQRRVLACPLAALRVVQDLLSSWFRGGGTPFTTVQLNPLDFEVQTEMKPNTQCLVKNSRGNHNLIATIWDEMNRTQILQFTPKFTQNCP